jgi:hypothetical protein
MFVALPIAVASAVFVLYAAVSTNLQVPCATQVLPTGIVSVAAIVGNVPLLIVALNIAPTLASAVLIIPVIFNSV